MLSDNDKTDKQLVQLAYLILNNSRAYMNSLKIWNSKDSADKTLSTFNTHTRAEYHVLRQVGALNIQ